MLVVAETRLLIPRLDRHRLPELRETDKQLVYATRSLWRQGEAQYCHP